MNVCVFCSSSNEIADNYKKDAYLLGKMLAKNGHTLIYGGATGGLMDSVAEGAASEQGKITGVIPEIIERVGRKSKLPTTLFQVKGMSERKQKMKELADVFVVLPGGYGTLDEMFDVIAAASVGEHNKPLICINENGFYDYLLSHINFFQENSFTAKNQQYKPIFVNSINECLDIIEIT